jgi:signal transduction histidine kinase
LPLAVTLRPRPSDILIPVELSPTLGETMSSAPNVIEFPSLRRIDRGHEEDLRHAAGEERLRIARELHDVVAYSFATIKVHAGVALHVVDEGSEQLTAALRAIDDASRDALGELREILGMLRGAAAPASGPGADRLDALATSMTAAGLPTQLVVTGAARQLPPAVDLAVFRIVQESLSNVLKHAASASATVTLAYEHGCVSLTVENDEGDQPDVVRLVPRGSGHGIVGMRERVAALGGELEAGLRAEGGFRVSARLPLFVRP